MQEFGLQREDQLFDPVTNAKAAYAIRKSQGLGAWTVYKTGKYRAHLAAAEAARSAPSLSTSPTPPGGAAPGGTSVATAGPSGPMGERQKNAGDLGFFIKKLGVARGSGVHEHPQHGGIKHRHQGRGHYEGRAIDIGGWGGRYGRAELGKRFVDDQSSILAGINQFAAKTGKRPSLVLHGDNDPGHWDHVHAEYERGGETLGFPHLATLGEKGREIVIDADSSGPAKNMLLAINQAKGVKGVMQAIQQYAPYDTMGEQLIFMPEMGGDEYGGEQQGSGLAMAMSGGGGGGDDYAESLYKGG